MYANYFGCIIKEIVLFVFSFDKFRSIFKYKMFSVIQFLPLLGLEVESFFYIDSLF